MARQTKYGQKGGDIASTHAIVFYLHCVPKQRFKSLCQKLKDFNDFCVLNPEKI